MFRGEKAAASGIYGWSGESVKMISQKLEEPGFELLNEGIKSQWRPDRVLIMACVKFGKDIANRIKEN